MQNYRKTISALAAATALVAGNASAEVEYGIHTGYTNEYIFRGIDLGDDLVEAGVTASTEYNGLGLSAGAWYGSFESVDSFADSADIDELDLFAEASKDFGFATFAVGYIYYVNMGNDNTAIFGPTTDDAQEVYFALAQSYFGVDFSLKYFWDIETDNDGYSELAASKGYEISSCLTLNTGAVLGYQVEQGQLAHLTAKASLDYAFTETATLSPFVAHSWALSDDADTLYNGSKNEFFAGTMLSVSF